MILYFSVGDFLFKSLRQIYGIKVRQFQGLLDKIKNSTNLFSLFPHSFWHIFTPAMEAFSSPNPPCFK